LREAIRTGGADCICSAEERGFVFVNGDLRYGPQHHHFMHRRDCPWMAAVLAIYEQERKSG
jgi:hypothetical protein